MPQSPWPAVACQGLYTKMPLPPPLAGGGLKEILHADAPPPHGMTQPPPEEALHASLHPTRKLLESRVTLNNIFNTLRWMPSA